MSLASSLTVVTVVGDQVPPVRSFELLAEVLQRHAQDFDFVLVANAVGNEMALELKALVAAVPDMIVVFLGKPEHDDVGRLVGIEHAVGDLVVFFDPTSDPPEALPPLLDRVQEGYDLVIADMPEAVPASRPAVQRVLLQAYTRVYEAMTGIRLEERPTGLRVLSRSAALFVAGQPNAQLLLRARRLGNGFPDATVTVGARAPGYNAPGYKAPSYKASSYTWHHAVAMLLSVSSVPLRGASYAALFGGGLSILYGLYVIAVYLFKPDVVLGWTTISLQIAAMMFIFSVVLFFISEYVIQIHSASPPGDRGKRSVPAFVEAAFADKRHAHALVIPVIDERSRIRRQLTEIHAAGLPVDVVVADGGSTDGSLDPAFLREAGVRTLLTKTGPGRLGAQLRIAFAWCLDQGYEGIVTMDGNGKDGVPAVADFVGKLREGFDYVQGSRYVRGGIAVNTPLNRKLAGRFVHAPLLSLSGRRWYTDTTNGFRGYSARFLLDPRVDPFRSVFDAYALLFYLTVRAGQLGFRTCEIPVSRVYPADAKTPTKIAGFSGRAAMMGELLGVVCGRYDP